MEVVLHLPVVPNVELVAAKAVETLGGALGMHQSHVEAASVAVVEACLNAMEHGGGPFTVHLRSDAQGSKPCLVIDVESDDVNADGSINIFDLIAIRNNLNHTASLCP